MEREMESWSLLLEFYVDPELQYLSDQPQLYSTNADVTGLFELSNHPLPWDFPRSHGSTRVISQRLSNFLN